MAKPRKKNPVYVRDVVPSHYDEEKAAIWSKINQRRRQVLIHSVLYYRLDKTIITDRQFDVWARELVDLQRQFPDVSESVAFHKDSFRTFDGTTGFDLPIEDPEELRKATLLYEYQQLRQEE